MSITASSRGRLAALTAAAAVAAGGVEADDADAACSSSTPAAVSFADDPFDGEIGLAPEIASVDVSVSSACELVVLPRLADRAETAGLIRDETVTTYVDTDGNPATGAAQWGGADRAVVVVGQNGPDLPPVLGTWTGAEFSFSAAPVLPVVGAAGFTTSIDQLGVPVPTTLALRVASSWSGLSDTYDDFAPEPGAPSFAFAVTFVTSAPGPPPPAAAPPPPTPPAVSAPSRRACTVPSVRRLTATAARRKLSRAGCRSRVVRVRSRLKPGRVVSTSPSAGARTRRTVVVRVSKGRDRKREG
jgi:PASTA domain